MSYASRVRGTSSPTKPAPAVKFLSGLSGLQVTVELLSGECYHGVLLKKSTVNMYYLGQVQWIQTDHNSSLSPPNRFEDERSFDSIQVACLRLFRESKSDRDESQYEFKTDAEIRLNRSEKPMRNLEKWDGGDDAGSLLSLDQEAKLRPEDRGWDQFKVNERLFGYQSSYAEDDYTTSIDRQSPFYWQNEPKARQVAAEIYNDVSDNFHIAEERGQHVSNELDEESRYSMVLDGAPSISPVTQSQLVPETVRASFSGCSSSSNGSSNPDRSATCHPPPKSSSESVSSENTSAVVKTVSLSQEDRTNSGQEPESAPHEEDTPSEADSVTNDKFKFNVGAKEFVPLTASPGIYFADGSYMPVVETASPLLPPMGIYPAYGFGPYYPQYPSMGFVGHSMMFPASPVNYPVFQHQNSHNANRSRPLSRSTNPHSKPSSSRTPEPSSDT